jgi:DNA-binding NtrC family response regulator
LGRNHGTATAEIGAAQAALPLRAAPWFDRRAALASMPLAGHRILIVGDQALIALDLEQALKDLHAIVVGSVNNVADACKLVSESKIDCAVLDVHLGVETVAALIPELDARHIPRVFMTALPEHNLPEAWTAWPVVQKPMVRSNLLSAIERVIENRSAPRRANDWRP